MGGVDPTFLGFPSTRDILPWFVCLLLSFVSDMLVFLSHVYPPPCPVNHSLRDTILGGVGHAWQLVKVWGFRILDLSPSFYQRQKQQSHDWMYTFEIVLWWKISTKN